MSTDPTTDEPARPTRERLAPLESDEVRVALVGMVGWAVALVVLVVFFRHDLSRHHATWWYDACGLGIALGLYGLRFALRRRGH